MRKITILIAFAIIIMIANSCGKSMSSSFSSLQQELSEYVESKDAS